MKNIPLNKKALFTELKARAGIMHTGASERLTTYFDQCLSALDDPNSQEAQKELYRRAYSLQDPNALRELNALRIIQINNWVTASSNASAFFNEVVLLPNETPYYENTTGQETKVRFVGQDGAPRLSQAIKDQSTQQVDLRKLATDKVQVPLRDIHKGEVYDQAKANYDIAYDLRMKRDAELWKLIRACLGSFNVTGPKVDRAYNLHSSVNPKNLPTKNLLTGADIVGNTNTSKFRFEVVLAAVKWAMAFGNNALSSGEITLGNIYVPSIHVGDMLDALNVNNIDNGITREIKEFGYVIGIGGKKINLVPDATLDPEEYRAYVRTNMPLGDHFTKPSEDQVFPTVITDEHRENNKVPMWMSEVYGAAIPNQHRMGVLALEYRTGL